MLIAQVAHLAHVGYELLVIVAQFSEHVQGRDVICIVVRHSLQAADVTDRVQGDAANFPNTFGNCVRRGKGLITLFIKEKMIVAKMGT